MKDRRHVALRKQLETYCPKCHVKMRDEIGKEGPCPKRRQIMIPLHRYSFYKLSDAAKMAETFCFCDL
jgi:hypothetical protein